MLDDSRSRDSLQVCADPVEPQRWALLDESEIEIPVSVNGKMRDVIKVPADADNAALEAAAKSSEKIKALIDGKPIKKVIVVPKKMVNIVLG